MAEITFIEMIGGVIGISALNVGVIMAYIRQLHNETEKDLERVRLCIDSKFNQGKKEHQILHERIDNEVSK